MGEIFAARYELVDPVGHGAVGAVWRAWDHRRRRYVAAKLLRQSDAYALLRFVREQGMRIVHPHVLAPASWAADDDQVLFTMDLVRGGSLARLIGDYGALPPRYAAELLDQLLAGLGAVHAEGVVHRDIKPANLLLEATGTGRPHLRVSDFGIAVRKGEPRLTDADIVLGTPGYFAPEQLLGAEPDFPADLFAAGLVALYLLQGRRPDSEELVGQLLTQGMPPPPEGAPEPLWQVVAGLVRPDPRERLGTVEQARAALAAARAAMEHASPSADEGEPVEIFDQVGPLPPGFTPEGPVRAPGGAGNGAGPGAPAPALPPKAGPGAAAAGGPDPQQAQIAANPVGSRPGPVEGTTGTQGPTGEVFWSDDRWRAAPAEPGPDPSPAHPPTGPEPAGSAAGPYVRQPLPPQTGPASSPGPAPAPTPRSGEAPHAGAGPSLLSPEPGPRPKPEPRPQAREAEADGEPPTPLPPGRPQGDPPPVGPPAPPIPRPHQDPDQAQAQPPHEPPPPPRSTPAPLRQVRPPLVPAPPGPPPPPRWQNGALPTSVTATSAPRAPGPDEPDARSAVLPTATTATAPARAGQHARPRERRPGPPARIAVPVVLLALVCYAVGVWSLTRP